MSDALVAERPEINVPALRELRATLVKVDPRLHDQTLFYQKKGCGTAMCAAGWTAHLAGYQPESGDSTGYWVHPDRPGRRHEISDLAQGLLGITQWDAWHDEPAGLFLADNSHQETLDAIDRLIALGLPPEA